MTKRAKLAKSQQVAPATATTTASSNPPAAGTGAPVVPSVSALAIGPLPSVSCGGDPTAAIWAGVLIQRPKPTKAVKSASASGPSTLALPALLAPASATGSAKADEPRPALPAALAQLDGAVLYNAPLMAPARATTVGGSGLCSIPEAFPLTVEAPLAPAAGCSAANPVAAPDAADAGAAKTPASTAVTAAGTGSAPADGSAPAATVTGASPAPSADFFALIRWAVSPSGLPSKMFF